MSQSQVASYDSSDSNAIINYYSDSTQPPQFCAARADPLSEPQPS